MRLDVEGIPSMDFAAIEARMFAFLTETHPHCYGYVPDSFGDGLYKFPMFLIDSCSYGTTTGRVSSRDCQFEEYRQRATAASVNYLIRQEDKRILQEIMYEKPKKHFEKFNLKKRHGKW